MTNVGNRDYATASEAQVIMHLAYPPLYSYAKTGVSEFLLTKPFNTRAKGASFKVWRPEDNSTFVEITYPEKQH